MISEIGASLLHPKGMPESSRGLSEAIPPVGDMIYFAPRRGARKDDTEINPTPLAKLLSCTPKGCGNLIHLPGVSLRSTPGYCLTSLRDVTDFPHIIYNTLPQKN